MVSGIIYCGIPDHSDASIRLQMAEGHLARAVTTISRSQVGTSSDPNIAYGNENGVSILQTLQRMESAVAELEEETQVARDERRVLREERRALRKETSRLSQEARVSRAEAASSAKQTSRLSEQERISGEQNAYLTRQVKLLGEEITILKPLQESTVTIRLGSFAYFGRKENLDGIGNHSVIQSRNATAHNSDVILDVCLFKRGLIRYDNA